MLLWNSARFLKNLLEFTNQPSTHIINQSLCTGIIPDCLEFAKFIPLFKRWLASTWQLSSHYSIASHRKLSATNYISISLIAIYFTTASIILDAYNPRNLHPWNWLTEFFSILIRQTTIVNISDLSKAFDTLNNCILLDKLKVMKFLELHWFESYVYRRQQFVRLDGTISRTDIIYTGAPQGSILGSSLFRIYINYIHMACKNFKAILYADDTNLISPLRSFNSS